MAANPSDLHGRHQAQLEQERAHIPEVPRVDDFSIFDETGGAANDGGSLPGGWDSSARGCHQRPGMGSGNFPMQHDVIALRDGENDLKLGAWKSRQEILVIHSGLLPVHRTGCTRRI